MQVEPGSLRFAQFGITIGSTGVGCSDYAGWERARDGELVFERAAAVAAAA
jgi:hypothetical protein